LNSVSNTTTQRRPDANHDDPALPRNASQAYDQIIATVGESLRQSPGFLSDVAQVSADGLTVTEVWETRDQWEQCYATTPVMPHPRSANMRRRL
jgi:hypothetical protein